MMRWPWRKRDDDLPMGLPADPDEWIFVPFRFAEAARLSIYTIAKQEDIPLEVRAWIAIWLANYNTQLVGYMQEHYGPNIFPMLDKITSEVWPNDEPQPKPKGDVDQETWHKWEQELKGGGNE